MGYVTAEEIRTTYNVTPEDFGLASEAELDDLIDKWSDWIKALIDGHRNRDFLDEAGGDINLVDGRIRLAAQLAVGNIVTAARGAQESAFVKVDDFAVAVDRLDDIFTSGVKRILRTIGAKPRLGGSVAHQDSVVDP